MTRRDLARGRRRQGVPSDRGVRRRDLARGRRRQGVPSDRGVRRRDLVLAAAGAVLARPAAAAAQDGDPAIVGRLIAREESAAFAHRTAVPIAGLAAHEAAHAKALRTHLAALGRDGPPPPRDAAQLDGPAQRVVGASGPVATLDAAIAMEARLLDVYAAAMHALAEPSILRTAATILASHAQHHALLLREAGRDPLQ